MKALKLTIEGMGCSGCVNTVESAISSLPGVKTVKVELESGIADVTFDDQEVAEYDLKAAIENSGYQMTGIQE